jgi:RNA recognition motif-containing protein
MVKNLFVAGLSWDTTSEGLGQYFSSVGNVTSANVIIDKYTNKSKGFGFVEMATEEEAQKAIDQLNNTTLDSRIIVVKEARPREDNGGRNFGGNGGGGGRRDFNRNDRRGGRDNRGSRNRY